MWDMHMHIVLGAKHIIPKAGRNDDDLSWNIMKKRLVEV